MKTFCCGIPDKILIKWLKNKKYYAVADEGEAIAIGVGFHLSTGKRATVFLSADGFANALNPITNLVIPLKIPINIVVSFGRQEPPHKVMSDLLLPLISLLPYDPKKVHIQYITKKS